MKPKSFSILGAIYFLFTFSISAGTIEHVSGIYDEPVFWCADTIKVTGNIYVNGTLNICPGTYVKFMGNYGLMANRLIAIGTASDSIVFSVNDTSGNYNPENPSGGWKGFLIWEEVKLHYCRIEFIKNLQASENIWLLNPVANPSGYIFELKHSYVSNNYVLNREYNIYLAADSCFLDIDSTKFEFNRSTPILLNKGFWGPGIRYNKIMNNNGPGINILSNGNIGPIYGNEIYNNNGSAISILSEKRIGSITGNSIYNNQGTGILVGAAKGMGEISNNFVSNNHTGMYIQTGFGGQRLQEISNNIILNNYQGGGIMLSGCPSILFNNLICNNTGVFGYGPAGGISISGCTAMIINNTICNNSGFMVGAIFVDQSDADIYNCIIRNNPSQVNNPMPIYENHKPILEYTHEDGFLSHLNGDIVNCDIEGIIGEDVKGLFLDNIDQDPLFKDTLNNDFRLSAGSLCINAGLKDTTGLHIPVTDLDGNPRISDLYIDMGAYEYHSDTLSILLNLVGFSATEGEYRQLKTNASGGVLGYQWQKDGTDLLDQKTNILQFVSIQSSDSGSYSCKILSTQGMISTDTVTVTVNTMSKLDPEHSLIDIRVYPNPTSGVLSLLFHDWRKRDLSFSVADLEGKVLWMQIITVGPNLVVPIDISKLKDGVYILLIEQYPVKIIKNSSR